MSRNDRNRNGILDREEIRRSSWSDDALQTDRNRDGQLTLNELALRYAMRRAAREGGTSNSRSASRDSSSRSSSRRRRGGDSRDGDDRGGSTRSTGSDGRASYRAQTAAERLANFDGLPEWFARSDADEDGQVRMAEYASSWSDAVVADFSQFDLNGDGIVTPSECLEAVEQGAVQGAAPAAASNSATLSSRFDSRRESNSSGYSSGNEPSTTSISTSAEPAAERAAPTGAPGNVSQKYLKYAVGVIKRYDTNRDGVLTADEWKSMPSDYSSADTNKDGRITPTELGSAYASGQ